ncbi:hypothetical protein FOM02_03960 [Bradyrhizobium sp. SEMIA]|nr:hypothetical protein FOM02_03960 [Bradyrhizobium sp. SEMIA]
MKPAGAGAFTTGFAAGASAAKADDTSPAAIAATSNHFISATIRSGGAQNAALAIPETGRRCRRRNFCRRHAGRSLPLPLAGEGRGEGFLLLGVLA